LVTTLFLLWLAIVSTATAAGEDPVPTVDNRIDLGLTAEERTEFLAEMRVMLASIQGILQGIGENDRERIAEAARQSGNRMARATPESVRAKIPQSFRDLGGPTHMLFEELAVRAETDDMDSLAGATAVIMNQCLACHAMFRVH
jgi:cytochrome c556